jgi:hypothetical protein
VEATQGDDLEDGDYQGQFEHQETDQDDQDEDLSESEFIERQTQEGDSRKKRTVNKVDKLFIMLYEDLNLLCEWEQDERNT